MQPFDLIKFVFIFKNIFQTNYAPVRMCDAITILVSFCFRYWSMKLTVFVGWTEFEKGDQNKWCYCKIWKIENSAKKFNKIQQLITKLSYILWILFQNSLKLGKIHQKLPNFSQKRRAHFKNCKQFLEYQH